MVPAVLPNNSFFTGTKPVYPGRYSLAHIFGSLGLCFDSVGLGAYYILEPLIKELNISLSTNLFSSLTINF